MKDIRTIDTKMLKLMRDLCPKNPGESVTFSALGKSVTLTHESRKMANEELKRRKSNGPAANAQRNDQ